MHIKKRFIKEILFLNPSFTLFYIIAGFLVMFGIRELVVNWDQNLFFQKIAAYQSGYLLSFNNEIYAVIEEELKEKKIDTSTMETKEISQIYKQIEHEFFEKFESDLIVYDCILLENQNDDIKIWTYDSDYCSIDNFSRFYLSKIKGSIFSENAREVIVIGKTKYAIGDLISYKSMDGTVYQIPIVGSIDKNKLKEIKDENKVDMFILNPQCDLAKKKSLQNIPSSYILYSDSEASMQNDLNKFGRYFNIVNIAIEKNRNLEEKSAGIAMILTGIFLWIGIIFVDQKTQHEKNYFYYLDYCKDIKKEMTKDIFFWLIIKKNIPIFFFLTIIFLGVMLGVLDFLLFFWISVLIIFLSYFLLMGIFFIFFQKIKKM